MQGDVSAARGTTTRPLVADAAATPFTINFIRREVIPLRAQWALIVGALGYVAVNGIVMIGLILWSAQIRRQGEPIQRQLQGALPSAGIGAIQRELKTLSEQAAQQLEDLQSLVAIQAQRFPIGGKLAAITRTLPPRTWVTGTSGDRAERTLRVQAAFFVNPDSPYELPTKSWMEALRGDPVFSQGLERLEVSSSARKKQGQAEVVSFELIAEWQRP